MRRAGILLAILALCSGPLAPAAAQDLRGTPGSATAVEFPNSRVLPQPPAPFAGRSSDEMVAQSKVAYLRDRPRLVVLD
jgi:hypothetical protein